MAGWCHAAAAPLSILQTCTFHYARHRTRHSGHSGTREPFDIDIRGIEGGNSTFHSIPLQMDLTTCLLHAGSAASDPTIDSPPRQRNTSDASSKLDRRTGRLRRACPRRATARAAPGTRGQNHGWLTHIFTFHGLGQTDGLFAVSFFPSPHPLRAPSRCLPLLPHLPHTYRRACLRAPVRATPAPTSPRDLPFHTLLGMTHHTCSDLPLAPTTSPTSQATH